jgi:uncharacterized spore protein YtfJ
MTANFDLNENINVMLERLEKFLTSKTVVGEPIEIGDTTLIPFITTSFGLGSGGGGGKDLRGNDGTGSGGGLGAKIAPTAVLVIKKDDIQMLPIKKNSGLEKLVEMVPDILVKFDKEKKEKVE